MLLNFLGIVRCITVNDRPQEALPAPQESAPAATSSTTPVNPAAGRSMQAKLNAIMQTASTFKNTRRNSGIFISDSKRPVLDVGNRQRASQLVQSATNALANTDKILYGGPVEEEGNAISLEDLYEQLRQLASDIKIFISKPASTGVASEDMPGVTPPGSDTQPRDRNASDIGPLESLIIEKCQEVIELLTPLCLAADHPDSTTDSVLDHYFEVKEGLPLGAELRSMLLHAALAQTVYADTLQENLGDKLGKAASLLASTLPESWVSKNISTELFLAFKTACPNLEKLGDGRLCDPDSGLVLQIFENPATESAVIAFGGTSAGKTKGPLVERVFSNRGITLRQWRANGSNATGVSLIGSAVPDSYQGAAQLTKLFLESKQGEKWSISLTGHSKGGAEAEFSALSNRLPAACFGTPPLGKHVLEIFKKEDLHAGERAIVHYFVKGDLAPISGTLLEPVLGKTQAHVGIGYWMDPTDKVIKAFLKTLRYPDLLKPLRLHDLLKPLGCHDQFFDFARDEAVRQSDMQDKDS